VPQAAGTLTSCPRLYRDFFTFIVFVSCYILVNTVCAFVLTSASKGGDLSVKRVAKCMFMDKLRVCVCISDYSSVEFTI